MSNRLRSLVCWFLLATMAASCGGGEAPVQPVRRNLVQAVYASGKIYPANYYKATATVGGYLQRIHVAVGDSVRVGQALFSIKNEVSDLAVNTAANNLQLAQSNASANSPYFQTLLADIAAARTKYQLDSTTYERYKRLREQNAGTDLALDQARTQAQTSRDTWNKARAAYNAARDKARTDVQNAQNALNAQQSQRGDFTVQSVINGRIYDIIPKLGELVAPQYPVMEVGTPGSYEVELSIDETDLQYIREGQDVVYESEAYPGKFFHGKLVRIYPKIGSMTKSIKALASIDLPQDMPIYAGATMEANIVYARRENVLVIPRYLLGKDSMVQVKSGVSKEPRKVKTGIYDIEYIEVLEGLTEKDQLVRP